MHIRSLSYMEPSNACAVVPFLGSVSQTKKRGQGRREKAVRGCWISHDLRIENVGGSCFSPLPTNNVNQPAAKPMQPTNQPANQQTHEPANQQTTRQERGARQGQSLHIFILSHHFVLILNLYRILVLSLIPILSSLLRGFQNSILVPVVEGQCNG